MDDRASSDQNSRSHSGAILEPFWSHFDSKLMWPKDKPENGVVLQWLDVAAMVTVRPWVSPTMKRSVSVEEYSTWKDSLVVSGPDRCWW